MLAVAHNTDQVLRLARLTDQHNCFVISDVVGVQLDWVKDLYFLKAVQLLEKVFAGHCCVEARTAGNHRQVLSKTEGLHSFEIRYELDGSLLSNLIIVPFLVLDWRFKLHFLGLCDMVEPILQSFL